MAKDLKDKKNLFVIAAIAFVVLIILIIAFFPKPERDEQGPHVITKRVKLNLIDETVNVGEDHAKQEEAKASAEPSSAPVEPVMAAEEKAAVPEPVAKPAAPVRKAAVKKAAPAPKKARTASVNRTALAERKPWAINVASFPNGNGARKLERSLDAAGYNAYTTLFRKDGINWTRVRVGFYASREEAQRSGDAIKRQYKVQSPWIVKPTKEETSTHIK